MVLGGDELMVLGGDELMVLGGVGLSVRTQWCSALRQQVLVCTVYMHWVSAITTIILSDHLI